MSIKNKQIDDTAQIELSKINLEDEPDTSLSQYVQLPQLATGSLETAASANEGGIVYDSTTNTVKFSDGSSWANVGTAPTDDLDAVFDNGKVIDGADSAANAFQVGDGTVKMKFYGDATDLHITTSSGDLLVAPAGGDVTITGGLSVSGTFAPSTLTATTANVTTATITTADITTLTLGTVDGFTSNGNSVFTPTATTGNGVYINGSSVTSGNVLRLEADATALNGGKILDCTVDDTSKFSVAEDGKIAIAGTAKASDAIAVTAGDCTLTSGHLVLSSGNATITDGGLDVTSTAGDSVDIVPVATGAVIDANLPGSYNLASGAIDIDGSTGSGPVVEIAMSGAYTGDYLSLNMTNAVGAKAVDLTGAGTRTAPLIHVTDVPADGAPSFNIDVTPGHANGNVFDIDVAGTSSAPVIDVAYAAAYTGAALNANMTNAVGANAIALTGAGTRTAPLVTVTDVPANGAPCIDLNLTPGHANGFGLDIDVAGTSSAPIVDMAFAAAYTGDAVQLNMTNAVGAKALDVVGAGTRTVSLVHLTDTPDHANGHTIDIDVTPGASAAQIVDVDVAGTGSAVIVDMAFAAAHTGDAVQLDMSNAVGAKALDIIGAGTRTVSLVHLTDTPDHANGVTLNVDVTPGSNAVQVLDIDVAGTNSADILAVDFANAYTGDAVNITMTNCGAAAQALVINGGHAASGNVVDISSSGAFAGGTGRLVSLASSGNLASATAGAVLKIAETGAAQATSFAVDVNSTNNEGIKVTLGKSHFVETVSVLEAPVFGLAANYVAAGGANNAITVSLVDSAAGNVALAAGLRLLVNLGIYTLQAGGNTIALNGGATKAIKKHTNPANDIGTAYVAGSIIDVVYDGTQWQDLAQ